LAIKAHVANVVRAGNGVITIGVVGGVLAIQDRIADVVRASYQVVAIRIIDGVRA
jgi:hypothetical protein